MTGSRKNRNDTVSIFIFIDALGWKLFKKTGFLQHTAAHEFCLKTILGYSSAAHPSIFSGLYPEEHGHWNWFYLSRQNSPFKWTRVLSLIPKRIQMNYYLRHIVEKICRRFGHIDGPFRLYSIPLDILHLLDYGEKRDLFTPDALQNGTSIFDLLKTRKISYRVCNQRTPEETSFNELLISLKNHECKFYLLYTPKLDSLMHHFGTNSREAEQKIKEYEHMIENIFSTAQEYYGDTRLFVFSDHGMTDVHESYNLQAEISRLGFKIPSDYVPFYDATMARFWFFSETCKTKVEDLLSSLDYGSILSEADLRKNKVFFEDNRFGEIIFLLKPGIVICPNYLDEKAPAAMHGYTPEDNESDALLLSTSGIDFRPTSIVDIFSIMKAEIQNLTS